MRNETGGCADPWDEGHPVDEMLLRVAEGAVGEDPAATVVAHLRACDRCASIVTEIARSRAVLRAALLQIDATEPASWRAPSPASARDTRLRTTPERLRANLASRSEAHTPRPRVWRLAAQFAAAATLIAGVAYGAVAWRARRAVTRPVVTSPPRPLPGPSRNVVMQPAPADVFQVLIDSAAHGSRVVISVAATGDAVGIEVRGARSPHFRSASDAMTVVLQRDLATIVITVPVGLASLRVVANGREVAHVKQGRVTPALATGQGIDVPWY